MRRAVVGVAAVLVTFTASVAPGVAQQAGSTGAATVTAAPAPKSGPPTVARASTVFDELVPPGVLDEKPAGHRLDGFRAIAIARKEAKVRAVLREHPSAYAGVYLKGPSRWQVGWYQKRRPPEGDRELVQVTIDDASGQVLEAWSGHQVAWTMARGYPGAFGRKVNSPWVWIPLTVLFVVPFLQPRRWRRMLHLDLLVMAAFGISVAYFNDAQIDVSVPFVYPLLVYLLARLLWIGLRRPRPAGETTGTASERTGGLPLLVPVTWLAIATVFLVGFRIGLNVTSSNVIDVGYAGVIGAQKLVDGDPLYGAFPKDNEHGDTYGPVVYEAYVPFEQVLPWSGRWDDLPAAHAASIAFDLMALVLVFLLGRRVRGPSLGIALAYGWAAYPFTLYAMNTNTNDALVTVFVLAALLASTAGRRGAAMALGGLTKFATLALAPLFATHDRPRTWPRFVLGFALAALVAMAPVLIAGESLSTMYDRTVRFQAERGSPFSIWGMYELDGLQRAWQAIAVALALTLPFLRRRDDVVGLAACAGAILIALQLGVTHWFYLYLVWLAPLVLLAALGREVVPAADAGDPADTAAPAPSAAAAATPA